MIIRNDNAAQRHSVIFQKLLRGGAVCAGVLMGTAAALAVPEIIKIEPLPDAIAAFKEEAPKVQARLDRGLRFASADQRAGRAGRTAPGLCVRLWTEREHEQRAPQELPEVKRLDLAEVLGEAFVTVYTEIKEVEYAEFMKVISPWEREHLLLHV